MQTPTLRTPTRPRDFALAAPLLLLLACTGGSATSESEGATDSDSDTGAATDSDTEGAPTILELDGPCQGPVADPSRLAVITTDFVNGSLSVADAAAMSVSLDVAAATTDTLATWADGRLYLVHRFGFNAIDVLDGASWAKVGSHMVSVDGVAEPNPQTLVIGDDGLAYLTLFGAPEVQVLDLAGGGGEVGTIDLSAFADDDGNPEAGVAIACGSTLIVGIQRLDPSFTPVDQSYLVALDMTLGTAIDLDPSADGIQGLALAGSWPRQIRVDPADPSGETILVLTSGIERIHLPSATREWALAAADLEAAGIAGFAPQAFVTDAAGEVAYLAASDGEWPAAAVFRAGLDGRAPTAPEKVISGIATHEKVLERIGDRLWVGDTTPGASGLRVWDLAAGAPTEVTAAPLDTGLPPYTLLPIP
ncbi:MAG: hypothetical protein H6711_06730 [Myxococcales bacterium]|nr:hypothetical protein [Myxococcales bacterium]